MQIAHANESQALFQSSKFQQWLQQVKARTVEPMAKGNQGIVWRYQQDGLDLAVKRCAGRGLVRQVHRRSLRREYRAYQRLAGIKGVAACLGMPDRDTLIYRFVEGTPYRQASFDHRAEWFEAISTLVEQMHVRGVAHGDLKRKENLLAGADGHPYILDFGTAWLHKPGWHPLNRRLFKFMCKLDNNAIIKHKYHGRYDQVQGADLQALHYTWPERLWRWLRPILGIK